MKNDFFKTSPDTKTWYLKHFWSFVYGYDPLHIWDEISMFLTLSSKISFDKSKMIFFKTQNYLMKSHINFVCIYEFEQSRTNLSFTFYLKLNLHTYKIRHKSSENLLLKIFFSFLTWSKSWFNKLDSSWVFDIILMRRLLNQHILAPKLHFESFVKVKHLLRSWSNIWD